MYAGEGGTYNVVNNYYKWGPDTKENVKSRIANPWSKPPSIGFGKYYIDGNYVDDSYEVSSNNWKGVTLEKDLVATKMNQPFPVVEVSTKSANGKKERAKCRQCGRCIVLHPE